MYYISRRLTQRRVLLRWRHDAGVKYMRSHKLAPRGIQQRRRNVSLPRGAMDVIKLLVCTDQLRYI
eukprot:scaffold393_cov147-Skeletonema_marinoi.AAC.3